MSTPVEASAGPSMQSPAAKIRSWLVWKLPSTTMCPLRSVSRTPAACARHGLEPRAWAPREMPRPRAHRRLEARCQSDLEAEAGAARARDAPEAREVQLGVDAGGGTLRGRLAHKAHAECLDAARRVLILAGGTALDVLEGADLRVLEYLHAVAGEAGEAAH